MTIEISELDFLVATDALETCLTVVTPGNEADAKNLEVMERVFKKFLNLKKELGFDVEEYLEKQATEFKCPMCGHMESYTVKRAKRNEIC